MKAICAVIVFLFWSSALQVSAQNATKLDKALEMEKTKRFPFLGKLDLNQNYPNPCTTVQETIIPYSAIDARYVSIIVYDMARTKVLAFENLAPGLGEVKVNGNQLKSGTYIYALIVNGRSVETRKMVMAN